MTRSLSLLDSLSVALFAVVAGLGLLVAVEGPTGLLPVHFNLMGVADAWSSRGDVGLGLGVLAAVGLAVSLAIGRQVARSEPGSSQKRGAAVAQGIVLATFALTSCLILALTLSGAEVAPRGGLMAGLGLIFTLLGAFLGRVAPNPFVGVRTPWSFKSRLAWDRSNRLAGRLFFFGGLATLATAPFAPQPAGLAVLIIGVLIAAGWSVLESWRVWRADPDAQAF